MAIKAVTLLFLTIWPLFSKCAPGKAPVIVEHPRSGVYARGDAIKLHCRTNGDVSGGGDATTVEWLKDGQILESDASVRIQESDYLMILSAQQGRRPGQNSDFGTYRCNASNAYGWTLSEPANVTMAFLRTQFLLSPQSVKAVVGDAAVFECRPPRGSPEPHISWWKDGVELPRNSKKTDSPSDGRVRYLTNGNLEIVDIRRSDAGHYVCRAENAADHRQTPPAILEVLEKPKITVAPENKTTSEGELVQFKCRAVGNPSPMIFWSRRNSPSGRPLPSRAQIVNADTLVINPIAEEDAGTYVCQARNEAGVDTREALLRVNSKPSFRVTPAPKTVAAQGRTVVMECSVRGYPLPAVYWQLPEHSSGIQLLLGQSHDGGRIFVADDGSLHIRNLRLTDSGRFTCLAISNLGRAEASTLLDVKQHDPRPAPQLVDVPPSDQLVLPKSRVTLRCKAEGDPQPSIRWNRDGRPLVNMRTNSMGDRFLISEDGSTLDIMDIQPQDAGVYACRAISETGETTATTRVRVDVVPGLAWEGNNGFDPRGAPGAPSRPAVLDAGDTVVSLTWTRSPYEGRAPVFGYVVEMLYLDAGVANWEVVDLAVPSDRFTVTGLRPSSAYQFRIRARNSFGYSLPSEASDLVRTLPVGSVTRGLPTQRPIQRPTNGAYPKHAVFRMLESEVISGDSVRLNWRGLADYDLVQHMEISARSLSNPLEPEIIRTISQNELPLRYYLITGLAPFSNYRVEVTPYFDETTQGMSQSVNFRTLEAAPSKSVRSLAATRFSNGTRIYVQWEPPNLDGQNGIIVNYRAQLFLGPNAPSLFPLLTHITNATTTFAEFDGLRPDEVYVVKVTAMNRAGEGPYAHVKVNPEGVTEDNVKLFDDGVFPLLTSHPAFLPTLLGSALGIVVVLLSVYTACICRRRARRYCSTKTSLLTVPVTRAGSGDSIRKNGHSSHNAFTYIQTPLNRGGVQQMVVGVPGTPKMLTRGSYRGHHPTERSSSAGEHSGSSALSPPGPDSGSRPLLLYSGPISGSAGSGNSGASRSSSSRRPILGGSDSASSGSHDANNGFVIYDETQGHDNYLDNIRPPPSFISPVMSAEKHNNPVVNFRSPRLPCQPRLGTGAAVYASLRVANGNGAGHRPGYRTTAAELARSSMVMQSDIDPVQTSIPSPPHSSDDDVAMMMEAGDYIGDNNIDFAQTDNPEYWDNAIPNNNNNNNNNNDNDQQQQLVPLLAPSHMQPPHFGANRLATPSGRILAAASQLQQQQQGENGSSIEKHQNFYSPPSLSKPLLFNGIQNAAVL